MKETNHRYYRRQRPLFDARLYRARRNGDRNALGHAFRSIRGRAAGGQRSRVPFAPRPRPSPFAFGAEFPRQHLRIQIAGRRSHPVAQRRRIAEGRTSAVEICDPRPIFRSHARPRLHVFRRRPGRARQLRRSGVPASFRGGASGLPQNRRRRRARRNVSLHGRPGVFHQSGIECLSQLGHGRHRHDQLAGGQARARSRALLRHHRDGDRLRLLARGARRRHGNRYSGQPEAERRQCLQGGGGDGGRACRTFANASADRRWRMP